MAAHTNRTDRVTDARAIALQALDAVLDRGRRVQKELNRRFVDSVLDERDRRLVQELVSGCVRRLRTLDTVIGAFATRPTASLDPRVMNILRLGVYQLLFAERIPPHAAVSESVALAGRVNEGRAKGFVNAILRRVSREAQVVGTPCRDRARDELPLGGGRCIRLRRSVLPDHQGNLPAFLGAAYSYPDWLVDRWLRRFGEHVTVEIMAAGNEPVPVFLRPNAARIDAAGLCERLATEGVAASPAPGGRTVRLDQRVPIGALAVIREGLCLVQDDSAAAVVAELLLEPGMRALDLCAAPGGKACQIAELVGAGGRVLAIDRSAQRLVLLRENAHRLELDNLEMLAVDATRLDETAVGHGFDRVLVDVPCSNTGVLRRRVEARWRLTRDELAALPGMQLELARAGVRALRPGGLLVYSTCSLEHEENANVINDLIAAENDLLVEREHLQLPRIGGGDGAYCARLRKAP